MKKHAFPFTLVELLVVIVIIAILAAMLLPALARAKDMAKNTQCVNVMKRFGVYHARFATDFNDRMVGGGINKAGREIFWWSQFEILFGIRIPPYFKHMFHPEYAKDALFCPVRKLSVRDDSRRLITYNTNLRMNKDIGTPIPADTFSALDAEKLWVGYPMTKVRNPATMLVLRENGRGTDFNDCIWPAGTVPAITKTAEGPWSDSLGIFFFPHGSGTQNTLFLDGHTAQERYSDRHLNNADRFRPTAKNAFDL